ncbi:hypothetical protein [Flavobacterium gelatinilyticum]|uniref:hypothetical protein n=1 Tax=Flavobacterium gelatinilyticum TaxID=3003260 RepID=UPI00248119EF|nr:hypothetical protein [Flavobacterium gelatinilyticum]
MKTHKIFETHKDLKEVHMTSDGEVFYNACDAKSHAKNLKDKSVELVVNPFFRDADEEDFDFDDDEDPQDENLAKSLGLKSIDLLKDNAGAYVASLGEDPEQEDPADEDPEQEDPEQEDPKQEDPKQEDPEQEDPKQEDPKQEEPAKEEPAGEVKEAGAKKANTKKAE